MPRVRELEVFRLTLPYGRRPESVLVKVTDYGGMVGWGEVVEPQHGHALEQSLPALIGVDWEHPSELGEIPGGTAGDMACWDLWGRMTGVPLSHALGGSRTSLIATVRLSADRSLESMVARVNRHVCAGYGHVTIDVHPGWDVEPLRAVRAAYPGLAIAVDGHGGYSDIAQLEALDSYDVVAIERPFKDLLTSADLQDRVSAAVAVEVDSVAELDEAVAVHAGSALLLRPARFGSLGAVRLAHDRAVEAGWDIVCAGGLGAGLARAATVAVASLPGCTLPSDVAEPPQSAQVVVPPVGASGGVVAVPLTQPGLGHTVDEARVRRLARESFHV
ncbi:O-succinylbenzoate-CoA synthase [Planotetraspora sp. A-T 1434]|uniref:enolase C-terminal domain-like protein n=1 Tax=Planotetraspora sp. A-T 1434 TaxID=2979219 RepID=UPI0021BF26D2|nr:enolase C-terminal domain-like protein [Planotetraspora sp. A-T 1434]MCT9929358.1 O-succinylbenzoate-CoA synthase [Planotetraspora sp. A-T 1434]